MEEKIVTIQNHKTVYESRSLLLCTGTSERAGACETIQNRWNGNIENNRMILLCKYVALFSNCCCWLPRARNRWCRCCISPFHIFPRSSFVVCTKHAFAFFHFSEKSKLCIHFDILHCIIDDIIFTWISRKLSMCFVVLLWRSFRKVEAKKRIIEF